MRKRFFSLIQRVEEKKTTPQKKQLTDLSISACGLKSRVFAALSYECILGSDLVLWQCLWSTRRGGERTRGEIRHLTGYSVSGMRSSSQTSSFNGGWICISKINLHYYLVFVWKIWHWLIPSRSHFASAVASSSSTSNFKKQSPEPPNKLNFEFACNIFLHPTSIRTFVCEHSFVCVCVRVRLSKLLRSNCGVCSVCVCTCAFVRVYVQVSARVDGM